MVNITTPNLNPVLLTLVTTCSIGTFEAYVPGSANTTFLIPNTINGIQCLLTTSGLPAYYLSFPETFVNIAIDPLLVPQIIEQFSPASFIESLNLLNQQEKVLKQIKRI